MTSGEAVVRIADVARGGGAARAVLAAVDRQGLLSLVTALLGASADYDGDLLDAAQEAIEAHGLAGGDELGALIAPGGAWRTAGGGRWLAARLLDLRGDAPAAEGAWTAVLEAGLGPESEAHLARARLRASRGAPAEAFADLREAIRNRWDHPFLQRAARLYGRLRRAAAPPSLRRIRVALAASSTTDLLAPLLPLLAFRDGMDVDLYVGPYGAYRQEILDPTSGLYRFAPDVVIIATHWRDAALSEFSDDPAAVADAVGGQFRALWDTLLERHPCTVIQHGFDLPAEDAYGHLGSALAGGRVAVLRAINQRLREAAPPAVAILDLEGIAAAVGDGPWADAEYWHAAKQHPSPAALPTLAQRHVALIRAAVGLTRKVLVLDLDNTLWHGIIGEDGLEGIQVGPPSTVGEAHAALQTFARGLRERGILLAVCSKNNAADARAPFERQDGMVLRLDDFAVFRANWEDKATNLQEIARLLNLGLDSFVFLDDNPVERARVRAALPEIAVPDVGPDPAGFVQALERYRYFEAWMLSDEDRQRTASYRTNAQREELQSSADSLEEFLRGLGMQADTGPFDEQVLARVVQLLGKTNQFNLTTRRHSEQRVREMMRSPNHWTQYFRLRDRFGDHGLIGVMIACEPDAAPATWEIDTWLMSCRVIGRQMEECMLDALLDAARAAGVTRIEGRYVPTPKNVLVRDLYPRMGFTELGEDTDGACRYELELRAAGGPRCVHIARATRREA